MEETKYISGTRAILNVLALLLIIGVFAALLLPINPRPRKDQMQRLKCIADMAILADGIEKYKAAYQAYPSGELALIVKKISGDNSQKLVFVSIKKDSINTNGEYPDPWGIPYVISFSSTNSGVIASAGKDKVFSNRDDVIFNCVANGFVRP